MEESVRPPLPRILFLISHLELIAPPSRLAREVASVLPTYAGAADIRVVDLAFPDVLPFAEEAQRAGEADVLVCTGATGAYLRRRLAMPVVLMRVTGFDILYAIEEARRHPGKPVVASYGRVIPELESLRRLWNVDVRQGTYTTLQDAQQLVSRLADEGCSVIIGSSMVTEIARQRGLNGVLAVSPTAIKRALDDALALLRSARADKARRNWLNAALRHLDDGVTVVDAEGRVQAINPALARLLDVPVAEALGRDIGGLAPQFELSTVLGEGAPQPNRVLALGKRTVLANAFPVYDEGRLSGAVVVCQEASAVQRADRQLRLSSRRQEFRAKYRLNDIVGGARSMRALIRLAERCAKTDSTVLICGENGTGKELFAQGIHNASPRAVGPFVAINCASLPESLLESELFGYDEGAFSGARKGGKPGLFEMAHMGTIFLDEIGDMPLPLQTRLLRALQEREVVRLGGTQPTPINVRVIAATHRRLRERVAAGEFREDLYYRLNILRLRLPPLRERREDIPALAAHILADIGARTGLHGEADSLLPVLLPHFSRYPWPGNIRELENVLERAMLSFAGEAAPCQADELLGLLFDPDEQAAPASGSVRPEPRKMEKSAEIERIRQAIEDCGGSVARAAERLGISRTTLWRRLKAAENPSPVVSR